MAPGLAVTVSSSVRATSGKWLNPTGEPAQHSVSSQRTSFQSEILLMRSKGKILTSQIRKQKCFIGGEGIVGQPLRTQGAKNAGPKYGQREWLRQFRNPSSSRAERVHNGVLLKDEPPIICSGSSTVPSNKGAGERDQILKKPPSTY